jgi:hypothetical protein
LCADDALREAVDEFRRRQQSAGLMPVVLIEGANRSAIEAYATSISRQVAKRLTQPQAPVDDVLMIATLVDGPAALGIADVGVAWGPVIHTDYLALSQQATEIAASSGFLEVGRWAEVLREVPALVQEPEGLDHLRRKVGLERRILWTRSVSAAWTRLTSLPAGVTSVTGSITFGWLLPRLNLDPQTRAVVRLALKEFDDGSASDDPRVSAWLGGDENGAASG